MHSGSTYFLQQAYCSAYSAQNIVNLDDQQLPDAVLLIPVQELYRLLVERFLSLA